MDQNALFESSMISLRQEKHRQDLFDMPGHAYNVETRIETSDREWCVSSVATLNDNEITDDFELNKETTCRKRVAQISKSRALWHLFVKAAAKMHTAKCKAVEDRLRKAEQRP